MKRKMMHKLETIVDHLIINTPNMIELGLLHGKMGVIIFFYNYSRYFNNDLYRKYADILLEDLIYELDVSLSYSFANGLCGIGWGIEYLLQNNFIKGTPDEILFELDHEIMKFDIRRIEDLSFENGFAGMAYYIKTRLLSAESRNATLPFDTLFRNDFLYRMCIEKEFNEKLHSYTLTTPLSIPYEWLGDLSLLKHDITSCELGIKNGLSGYGLICMQR